MMAELRAVVWNISDGGPLYWVVIFVHNAGYYYKRYEISAAKAADLNAQLAQAQLQSLKMQTPSALSFQCAALYFRTYSRRPQCCRANGCGAQLFAEKFSCKFVDARGAA